MSMINEQITTLREISTDTEGCCYPQEYLQKVIGEAADTIEALSAKPQAANMENGDGWILVEENGNFNFPEDAEHTQSHGWSKEIRPSDYVLCESTDGNIFKGFYSHVYNTWTDFKEITEYETNEIIRWKPLPEPYRP